MQIHHDSTGTIKGLEDAIGRTLSTNSIKSLIVFTCDDNNYSSDSFDSLIKSIDVPICGGIFPAIINNRTLLKKGAVVLGVPRPIEPKVIPGLSDSSVDYENLLDELYPEQLSGGTMMVLVDGLATRISSFVESLFTVFGLEIGYIGGGAGSLSMVQKPCLFTNDGLIRDSALLLMGANRSGIGVSHGWQPLSGPYRVTESENNVIKSLDWRPAFELYSEVVSEHLGVKIDEKSFYDNAKSYPFGITRMGDELIVRDPIQIADNTSLVCVGEVPEGSFVSILNGDSDTLINAAGNAFKYGKAAMENQDAEVLRFAVDCISRVLFLDNKFDRELEALCPDNVPMVGVCTLGEIANCGDEFLEFYNKTTVIAMMEKA